MSNEGLQSEIVQAINMILAALNAVRDMPLPTNAGQPLGEGTFEDLIKATGAVPVDDAAKALIAAQDPERESPGIPDPMKQAMEAVLRWAGRLRDMDLPEQVGEDMDEDEWPEDIIERAKALTAGIEDYRPRVLPEAFPFRVAKVTDATSAPVYTVTEQLWTSTAFADGTAPTYAVSVSATEFNASDKGVADDLALFWEHTNSTGARQYFIALILTEDETTAINTDENVKACSLDPTADTLDNQIVGDGSHIETSTVDVLAIDFTDGWTELDPNSQISVAADQITVTDFQRAQTARVHKDYGAAFFTDDLVHRLKTRYTADGGGYWTFWAISNDVNEARIWTTGAKEAVRLRWHLAAANRIQIVDSEDDSNEYSATLTINTWYYLTITRSGTTISVAIRTGSYSGTLVDTITTTLAADRSYRYLFATNSYNYGAADTLSGDVAEMSVGVADYKVKVSFADGSDVAQMLFWDNTDSKWVFVAAPADPSNKDYTLMFDHTAAHGVQVKWVETATFACP